MKFTKLVEPVWVESRWSVIFERIIPAHMIETKEALEGEIEDMKDEIEFRHPTRKYDGKRDKRYARNR